VSDWLPPDDWRTVVAGVPIPSVDLIVVHDGGVVLGRRTNDPARGEWFVPGGRVRKGERLPAAVDRVARDELGVDVTVRERLGAFTHLWETSDVPGTDEKHYVAVGFVVEPSADPLAGGPPDDQHDEFRAFRERPPDCHEYVAAYLDAAGLL
jgi:colanic acid biosynthesis protein WcaH